MKKTSPTGVRFDSPKLDFIKIREGLETPQQVVTFLVDKYWWESHGTTKNISTNVTHGNYEVQKEVPKFEIKLPQKTFKHYMSIINDLLYEQEFKDFVLEVQTDTNLTNKERETILLALRNQSQ